MPQHRRHIEEEGLQQKQEGHPLIITDLTAGLMWSWDVFLERQEVGIVDPAVAVGVLNVTAREVLGCPAGDGSAHILLHGDHHSKGDKDHHGVAMVEAVNSIIIMWLVPGWLGGHRQQVNHPGFLGGCCVRVSQS